MRATLVIVLCSLAAAAQQPDPRELVRQAFAQDENIFNSVQDYTYTEDETERHLDGKGRVTSEERTTYEVLYLYGRQFQKRVAKNGKPLSPSDTKKEEDRLARAAEKRKQRVDKGKVEDERTEGRKAAREVADAFDFHIAGSERTAGVDAWVLDAVPRKGFVPKSRDGKYFQKISGRLWISQADHSLVKVALKLDDTISLGLFLVRLKPGARFEFERTRLAENVWLPKHVFIKGDAKIGLVKTMRLEVNLDYSDYKKFSTDTSFTVGAP